VYKIIKSILFLFQPETAHRLVFNSLKYLFKVPLCKTLFKKLYCFENPGLSSEIFGIRFPNPVGLAAGMDKDAELIDELAAIGFGFIEIGAITPEPQPGNAKPRLFRIKKDKALINRMGFNNKGLDVAVKNLVKKKSNVIVGGNIGKNKWTENEAAIKDFEICFEKLFDHVDYFSVNVSSPNTPGLRDLQEKEPLKILLARLKFLNSEKESQKPILLKIAPDLTFNQLDDIVEIVKELKIDGVIATNTTTERNNLTIDNKEISRIGIGGLSGKPLRDRSTEVIRYLRQKSEGAFHIIGVGGIMNPDDALEKLKAGASLIQIYTGFVYHGPGLVKKINKKILQEKSS
jgi:dihydroorotate dehydrogenase